ncbi:MAG: Wzt carbohydrate-binding domain-containing protein [Rhodoferax sp.]|nr:Wzt carbohydrate-binding domain-containing protein [Rhodoferax sp.]
MAPASRSDLRITIDYAIDPGLPEPSVALGIADGNGLTIASATSRNDGVVLARDGRGLGSVTITFTKLPLLKGTYRATFFLACENAVHLYDQVDNWLVLNVSQDGIEQGLVALPHQWQP